MGQTSQEESQIGREGSQTCQDGDVKKSLKKEGRALSSTMRFGRNKCLTKGNEKGTKKKGVDPISKKDWCHVNVPAMFNIRNIGKTLVTRTQGTKIAPDGFKGHVFEVSFADLQNDDI